MGRPDVKNTVLLADADIGMQLLLSRLLIEDGYAVLTAGDAAEAIARIETHQPDLLVASMDLPGKSGAELARFVKSTDKPIPVVVLAPGPDAQVPEADATIPLPIDPQKVLETVQGILRRAESGEAPPSRLLVVDDDLGILNLLHTILTNEGYEVVTADCGRDGLAAIEREVPDLVLLDVQMPGMSGFEVLAAIRQNHQNLPVIMITGYGSEDVATQALRLGADDYLTKPLKVRNVCFRIQNALERARLRASQQQLNRLLRRTTLDLTDRLEHLIEERRAFSGALGRILEAVAAAVRDGHPEAADLLLECREALAGDQPATALRAIADRLDHRDDAQS